MIEFKNIEKLEKFIDKYLKQPFGCYDIEAVKNEVWSAYCNGCSSYELSKWETVDGQTHCLDFTVTVENDATVIEF